MPVSKEAVQKAKPKRKNSPSYVVFRIEVTDGAVKSEAWVPVLGRTVNGDLTVTSAATRKNAVEKATAQAVTDGAPPESKAGMFAVIPAIELAPIKRKVRMEEVSEFE